MDEFRFVMKCFAFAVLLLLVSQLKTKHGTIESELHAALVNSKTAEFVNKAAEGGVKLIRNGTDFLKSKVSGTRTAANATEAVELIAIPEKKKAVSVKTASDKTIVDVVDESVEEIE